MPKLLFIHGGTGRTESVVVTLVSQQARPSMLPIQLQSVPVKTRPGPSGPYTSSMTTSYAHLLVATSEGVDMGITVGGGDNVYIEHLNWHLRGRLELPKADVGVVSVDVLLDSGSGETGLSEGVLHRLQQQWLGRELSRSYISVLKAPMADGRELGLTE